MLTNAMPRYEHFSAFASREATSSAILAALPCGAAILDHRGIIVRVNEAWTGLAARSSAGCAKAKRLGMNYLDACRRGHATEGDDTTLQAARAVECALGGYAAPIVLEYACTVAGEDRWFEMRAQGLPNSGALVMHLDITDRKRHEAQALRQLGEMAHVERVAEMAQLASALAHEIMQPLTAILSNAEAASQMLRAASLDLGELRVSLDDIIKDDRRAARVIGRMRRMLRKAVTERSPVSLNETARAAAELVASSALLRRVDLEVVLAPELPLVLGDGVQLQQIVLNLLLNAISAAADGVAPRLVTLRTAVAEDGVELCVEDSGKGVDERYIERIFEPFFTTKSEGLGMGLAISRSIARAHGGRLWAENKPDGGTTFRLRLHGLTRAS